LLLFERGPDFARLRAAQERLMQAGRAPATREAYANAWRDFDAWGRASGRVTFPASEDTLCLYVAALIENPHLRLNTIKLRLSALRIRHHDEGLACEGIETARRLVLNAARERKETPRGKRALTPDQLRRISAFLDTSAELLDVRDRAIVVFGFALGWRSAELVGLDLRDVRFVSTGIRVRLRHSKTDQQGKGHEVGIPPGRERLTCPVRALGAWLARRGNWEGPLFTPLGHCGRQGVQRRRLGREAVIATVRRELAHIGVENLWDYGSHSLRVGMITASAEAGAGLTEIMQRSGHTHVPTVLSYIRPAQAFQRDPLAGVL
jgi:integrase